MRRIIDEIKSENVPCIVTFADFKKAFDSVKRTIMFRTVGPYICSEKTINAIDTLYSH